MAKKRGRLVLQHRGGDRVVVRLPDGSEGFISILEVGSRRVRLLYQFEEDVQVWRAECDPLRNNLNPEAEQ